MAEAARELEYMESGNDEVLLPVPHNREGEKPANARSEEEVFETLKEIVESGGNVLIAARNMGIPVETVRRWSLKYREETETLAEIERARLARLFGGKIKELVSGLTKSKLEKASVRDLGVVAGIFTDKFKDLTGNTKSNGDISLKIAWKDGGGAVELTTGDRK